MSILFKQKYILQLFDLKHCKVVLCYQSLKYNKTKKVVHIYWEGDITNIRDKLYKKENKTIPKSINIDDGLYEKIRYATEEIYDAKLSDIINVALEEYIERNKPSYYAKPKKETVTYRNLMLRKNNIKKLNQYHQETGISFTRLVNGAIKEFFDKK